MTIIECIKKYLQGCPALQDKRIDIDCLASKPESISIDVMPSERIVKRYLDGSAVCRMQLTVSSRMYYGTDMQQQAENVRFFDEITDWLMMEDLLMHHPDLGKGRTVRSFSALGPAYPMLISEEMGLARYQIQMEIIYLQEVIL